MPSVYSVFSVLKPLHFDRKVKGFNTEDTEGHRGREEFWADRD